LATGGTAYCWGYNGYGQLGDGTSGNGDSSANRLVPVAVSGGRTYTALVAGGKHTCGLATGGTAYCWGWNRYGQLGDGTSGTDRLVPVAVSRRI
ncbi:MAG: cell wall anchor protein, partial [Actinobacteria bacterium]|nr:cell wall anchor protein [Actinomycetota bacterium]